VPAFSLARVTRQVRLTTLSSPYKLLTPPDWLNT